MFDISQEYGVKLKKLYRRNRMETGSEPQAGQRIKLRGWRVSKAEKPRSQKEPKPDNVPVIIDDGDDDFMGEEVSPEDTTTTTQPNTAPTKQPNTNPSAGNTYTVAKGDTLYSISRRFGLTVNRLMQLNNLSATTIHVGQVLRVK